MNPLEAFVTGLTRTEKYLARIALELEIANHLRMLERASDKEEKLSAWEALCSAIERRDKLQ